MKIFLLLVNCFILAVLPISAFSFLNVIAVVMLVVAIAFDTTEVK